MRVHCHHSRPVFAARGRHCRAGCAAGQDGTTKHAQYTCSQPSCRAARRLRARAPKARLSTVLSEPEAVSSVYPQAGWLDTRQAPGAIQNDTPGALAHCCPQLSCLSRSVQPYLLDPPLPLPCASNTMGFMTSCARARLMTVPNEHLLKQGRHTVRVAVLGKWPRPSSRASQCGRRRACTEASGQLLRACALQHAPFAGAPPPRAQPGPGTPPGHHHGLAAPALGRPCMPYMAAPPDVCLCLKGRFVGGPAARAHGALFQAVGLMASWVAVHQAAHRHPDTAPR